VPWKSGSTVHHHSTLQVAFSMKKRVPSLLGKAALAWVIICACAVLPSLQGPAPTTSDGFPTPAAIAARAQTKTATRTLTPTALPSPTPTDPPFSRVNGEIRIKYATLVFYPVKGTTEQELRESLNTNRPTGFDGTKGDATTAWTVYWNWPGYGEEDCNLAQAVVSYKISVTFPQWDSPAGASPALVKKWNQYIDRLALHEAGHAEFIADHYRSVLDAIHNATCPTVDEKIQAVLNEFRKHDVDYDAETNHGATQGAFFP
jgi:predicted secreted Zn-dependent protease